MKSYTDIEQSRKLAEILPLESADMCYPKDAFEYNYAKEPVCHYSGIGLAHPCWSLATLIDIIENIDKTQKVEVSFKHNGGKYWVDVHFDEFGSFCQDHELYDSKIDALIAMIENFKNRNLL